MRMELINQMLEHSGLCELDEDVGLSAVFTSLERLREDLKEFKPKGLETKYLQQALMDCLKNFNIDRPAAVADQVIASAEEDADPLGRTVTFPEIEPWPGAADGVELLDEIKSWTSSYVVLSEESLISITLWSVATHFVSAAYFAPILAILSPTKRSGKTLVLDLLRCICRKAVLTSGVGVTSAVIFRMNQQHQPTFLIDEAEKLSGKNADRAMIGLLNQGYRRGSKIQRCREKGGEYLVEEFDAFGFRTVAAIGTLWGTIIDRGVVILMKRKPKAVRRRRYDGRVVENEGKELSQRICRFVQDNMEAFDELQVNAPRPEWLDDRAFDNWSALFTVARLAGGDWPELALNAAKNLSKVAEDGDRAELLIHDTRRIFEEAEWPEVVQSGDLVQALNTIELSPWGDYSKGQGITTHKVAALFKPFGIRPCQERDSSGEKIRGYWLKDLQEMFTRYPIPLELGQVRQPNNDRPSSDIQSGTEDEFRPTSQSPEIPMNTELSPIVPL